MYDKSRQTPDDHAAWLSEIDRRGGGLGPCRGKCGRAGGGGSPAQARPNRDPPLARLQSLELLPGPRPRREQRLHGQGGRLPLDPRLGLRLRAAADGLLALGRFRLAHHAKASPRGRAEDQGEHAGKGRSDGGPGEKVQPAPEPQLPSRPGLLHQRSPARAVRPLDRQAGGRRVCQPLGHIRQAIQRRLNEGPELQPGQRGPRPAAGIYVARGLPPRDDPGHGEDPRDEPRPAGNYRRPQHGQHGGHRDDPHPRGPERPRLHASGDQPLPAPRGSIATGPSPSRVGR